MSGRYFSVNIPVYLGSLSLVLVCAILDVLYIVVARHVAECSTDGCLKYGGCGIRPVVSELGIVVDAFLERFHIVSLDGVDAAICLTFDGCQPWKGKQTS